MILLYNYSKSTDKYQCNPQRILNLKEINDERSKYVKKDSFMDIEWCSSDTELFKTIKDFDYHDLKQVLEFHKSLDGYKQTPLVNLSQLADHLGVTAVLVKDESFRFSLKAFKALGGVYAIAKYLNQEIYGQNEELDINRIFEDGKKGRFSNITFITATDGNHGKGIAWAASQFDSKSLIYMPHGSSNNRVKAIQDQGGEVIVTDLNYDDTVRLASKIADDNGFCLIQDTAWPGYETIPLWISQGYTTLAIEAMGQMKQMGYNRPTHLFLQAGVGSFAGAILSYFINELKLDYPVTAILEAKGAECINKSIQFDDGKPHVVTGQLKTIMAGLACGEPSTNTWPVLRDYAKYYIVCPDYVAAEGMRYLAHPNKDDEKVISGESGAVSVGLLSLMTKSQLTNLKDELGLNSKSVILCISTEGDTDESQYKRIVKDMEYPVPF